MRILILGAGKMGAFLADVLSPIHEVAIFDQDRTKLRFLFNTIKISDKEEIRDFNPEIVINAVTIKYTIEAFESILDYISPNCILSDIASVKTGLHEFYLESKHPFASTHPMFGPTFANLNDLSTQYAILIKESDHLAKIFFKDLFLSLNLNLFEYTFEEHDKTIAYSLTTPFVSTLAFTGVMEPQEAPGTTFKKHLQIAQGLLAEDEYLVQEILYNPYSVKQIDAIQKQIDRLKHIIINKDNEELRAYLAESRKNIQR